MNEAPKDDRTLFSLFGVPWKLTPTAANFLHIIGHILGGKVAGCPMSASLIIGYQFTTYCADEPTNLPCHIQLTRTIGGPLMNFIIAAAAYFAWLIFGTYVLLFATIINLFLASLLFLPFKGTDGEIF